MAKQFTVRGIDDALERRLRGEAKRRGLSLNRTTLDVLRQGLGLRGAAVAAGSRPVPYTDLDHLAGTWSAEEAQAFDRALDDIRRIDRELWP